jgi:hypothetical protein
MTSISWKSAEILKVFGTTIREGIYTGGKTEVAGGITTRDSPTQFTPAKIARIYENITTHVPLYLGHDGGPTRKPIGYAYKFGVTETLDDIKYNGFIFDKDAMQKIITEGYDRVSPEITEDVEHLVGIAFVPNPAIDGTEADMEQIVFSKGDTNIPGGDNSMTDETTTTQPVPAQTHVQPVPAAVKTETVIPAVPDVSALVTQVEDFRGKYEQATAKIETLMTQQYDTVVAEMKSLGVSDPGSIVRGLPTEQKIAVLSKMKESIVLNKPLASPTPTSPADDKSEVDKALNEVLTELGVSKEEYSKISKR